MVTAPSHVARLAAQFSDMADRFGTGAQRLDSNDRSPVAVRARLSSGERRIERKGGGRAAEKSSSRHRERNIASNPHHRRLDERLWAHLRNERCQGKTVGLQRLDFQWLGREIRVLRSG